ncbi:MAG: flagellar biosynthesis protein FlhA [Acidithiobacillus ferriphilus]|nr:flagellar biosynthesis protein FlhA [Acidithiobacillus ferriphilus]MEB8476273.1 flagellar biosynthesis protein FlhA [Acidithiobacillus ferriphilus]UEP60082.1 flagellar biosynthesis protein FlhA [Acidithiobacillus ferriphilus]
MADPQTIKASSGAIPAPVELWANYQSLLGPLVLIMILTMIVVPLPPILLDVLFTFNITFSLLILFAALHVKKPLDFSAFPTVLLLATLLRLALNVAAARVILLHGFHGTQSAGIVIESFGRFVVGGDYVVGIVVFAILIIINFVVVTKGSSRIAEVGARFSLDAMPGKQMAIDADLNAGMITQIEARRRRDEVSAESDFYGSMDGASKFVRGDAIAAILIIIINLVGGLIIGVFQHNLSLAAAAKTYTLLSIGDGLVAQIPSLVISMAAGILVSRSGTEGEVGHLVSGQVLGGNRKGLLITAVTLGITGIIPGMPHVAFLFYAVLTGILWQVLQHRATATVATRAMAAPPQEPPTDVVDSNILRPVEPLSIAIGYQIIPLIAEGGDLQKRLNLLRRRTSENLGFLLPSIHVHDDLTLHPGGYRIQVHGVRVATGDVRVGSLLAISGKTPLPPLEGIHTTDPVFGASAYWIAAERSDDAELLGYTVIDPATVITTHTNECLTRYIGELFGLRQTQELLDIVAARNGKLLESVVPRVISVPALSKVLRELIVEGVSIRDMPTILETLAENGQEGASMVQTVEIIRSRLGRQILSVLAPDDPIQAAILGQSMEQLLLNAVESADPNGMPALEPSILMHLMQALRQGIETMQAQSLKPLLVVRDPLRQALSTWLHSAGLTMAVVAFSEVPGARPLKSVLEIS